MNANADDEYRVELPPPGSPTKDNDDGMNDTNDMNDDHRAHRKSKSSKHGKSRSSRHGKSRSSSKRHHTSSHKRSRSTSSSSAATDDDASAWVEKSPVLAPIKGPQMPPPAAAVTAATDTATSRPAWMLDAPKDLFGGGQTRQEMRDVAAGKSGANGSAPLLHTRELNPDMRRQYGVDNGGAEPSSEKMSESVPATLAKPRYSYGDSGSQWRMMKLKRVHEQAEREQRPVEEIALERFGSIDELDELQRERDELDRRRSGGGARWRHGDDRRDSGRGGDQRRDDRDRRDSMRHDDNVRRDDRDRRESTRSDSARIERRSSGFVRPGESPVGIPGSQRSSLGSPSLASARSSGDQLDDKVKREKYDRERESRLFQPISADYKEEDETRESVSETKPIPAAVAAQASTSVTAAPPLSLSELNKLKAKAMRARIMNIGNADALDAEYEREKKRADEKPAAVAATSTTAVTAASSSSTPMVIPTFNVRGEYQDIGSAERAAAEKQGRDRGGKQQQLKKRRQDDEVDADKVPDLQALLRHEKLAGNSFDMQFAQQIARDAQFKTSLDYLDDHVKRFSKQQERSELSKRNFAISDYKKTQATLDRCWYCCGEDRSPQVSVAASGVQVYLALPKTTAMVPGHCMIVPTQHRLSSLECDDNEWDEIRNFMKCLIRAFDAHGKGVVFMETAMHFKRQRHCVIECIPIKYGDYEEFPAYFKQSILTQADEWATNRKIIDTTTRGFRKSLVKNLPYFHVWLGVDGGYGHVIESEDGFSLTFGKEVVAGMLDLSSELWRKPRVKNHHEAESDLTAFRKIFDKYDWTKQLAQ